MFTIEISIEKCALIRHLTADRRSTQKVTALLGYFELSGLSIHKIVTNDHFLTIPDEFRADYHRTMGGLSIGLFFFVVSADIPTIT